MTPADELKLSLICPQLASKIRQLAGMMALVGEPITVEVGLRSWAEQQKLYNQGRTTPGPIVTDAPPGHSWHFCGLAADLAPMNLVTQPNWDPANPEWGDMGAKAESLGLTWGGEFHHRPDKPHLQLTGSFPVSPTDEVRQIFLNVGMMGVWVEAGLFTLSA